MAYAMQVDEMLPYEDYYREEGFTGLPRKSVADVSQVVTLDKALLRERTAKLPRTKLELVLSGLDVVLGRQPMLLFAIRTCALNRGSFTSSQ